MPYYYNNEGSWVDSLGIEYNTLDGVTNRAKNDKYQRRLLAWNGEWQTVWHN